MKNGALSKIRVDQVGSLLRPQKLKEAYARHGRGQVSDAELRQVQDEAVRDLVAKQERRNLPVLTDGEFRRLNFQDSFAESVTGFLPVNRTIEFHERRAAGGKPFTRWNRDNPDDDPSLFYWRPITERLRLARNLPLEEYRFAQALTSRPVKITLICPDRICEQFDRRNAASVYKDIDDFLADVVRIERGIVAGLIETGCRYIQIDAPSYTSYVDPPSLARMRRGSEDPMAIMERSMKADNAVIAGFEGVTFGIHLCRGNQRSMWHREGSYDAIAERLFNTLSHHRLLLEYDTERAGGFEPLRFVPKDKVAVLGLVSSKVSRVETADELKRRIEEAGRYLPVEQLALSPQCGFASNILGNLLSEDDQWRKFDVIQEVAAQVWPGR
ncbi:MAG: methionine synthase [Deltaproteobacteria bacterium]|nr:MAG: methionine synthase [Deltaproteobacteria bacterium]